MDKVQVATRIPKAFLAVLDSAAKLTGSTRSEFIRRALEHYITELKQANLIQDLRERRL